MPTINAASTPSRNVTTRAENIGLRFDYENEIQFHFQLEIVPSRADGSQQIENTRPRGKVYGLALLLQNRARAISERNSNDCSFFGSGRPLSTLELGDPSAELLGFFSEPGSHSATLLFGLFFVFGSLLLGVA
jgi:hypothetical protein